MLNPWIVLIAAGALEVAWASLLPATRGFTRLTPSLLLGLFLASSMVCAAFAARTIPISTTYGVWVGIGAAGTAIVGFVAYGETVTAAKLLFLVLLIVSIVGLRVTSTGH
ncbi:MAG: multidrug efflux SMR transporter [Chloroflexi bacterium]|nr:multidrug efflux SMR transporter [Chloroflexota bacterium]